MAISMPKKTEQYCTERVQRALYGRRLGRPLRPQRQNLIDNLLPKLEINLSTYERGLHPNDLFAEKYKEYWLEIGFGGGEHIVWQALNNPDVGIIGCEPYLNGVARLLVDIDRQQLNNIRIFKDDSRLLIDRLATACLSRVFVLFPDPWSKTRHHKRRIIEPTVITNFARIMKQDTELRIATDDSAYKTWILTHMHASSAFYWCAGRPDDWRVRPIDWPQTRYEKKAKKAGRRSTYFIYLRRDNGRQCVV